MANGVFGPSTGVGARSTGESERGREMIRRIRLFACVACPALHPHVALDGPIIKSKTKNRQKVTNQIVYPMANGFCLDQARQDEETTLGGKCKSYGAIRNRSQTSRRTSGQSRAAHCTLNYPEIVFISHSISLSLSFSLSLSSSHP